MIAIRTTIRYAVSLAEVGRWRLSKALGVPGLERITWSCIAWSLIALGSGVLAYAELLGWLGRPSAAEPAPLTAVINFWVYLAVLVVSMLVSYALRPKPETPKPNTPNTPVVEDGMGIIDVFGTVWINDPIVLAWLALSPTPIRKKGGKK